MMMYDWLNSKKSEISIIVIWSLFVSAIIKALCSVIHEFILPTVSFSDAFKILIYGFIGLTIAFLATYIKKIKFIEKILYKTNNKTINDDVFNDVIDDKKPMMMHIFLKNSDIYYIGKYCLREEKGLDSWIVLINYCIFDKNTDKLIYNSKKDNQKMVAMINLHDVERIENLYDNNSKVWARLTGKEQNN